MMAAPSSTNVDVSLAARQYVGKGWVLVPIAKGTKGPNGKGWNQIANCITQPEQCSRVRENVGLALAYSRLCTLDLDHIPTARDWLAERGADLDALLAHPLAVRISSGRPNRGKLLYRLPEGTPPIASKVLTKEAGLEFRCATADGLTLQDVLPPSIHPETGEAYRWEYGDDLVGHWSEPQVLPAELLTVWQGLHRPKADDALPSVKVGMGVRGLLECLDAIPPEDLPYTAEDGASWLGVGLALHHESGGSAVGLDLWDDWSSKDAARYKGREDLATRWDGFGKRTANPITARSLLAWGRAEGADLPDASDFEDLSGEPDIPKPERFQVLQAGAFAQREPLRWLVKGFLPKAQLAVLFGESGAGKTFAVLDIVLAIVRGLPEWRGHKVKPGRVVYIVAEGAGGFQTRLQAYAGRHGVDLAELNLGVIADAPNLLAHDDKLVAKQIAASGGADLIVVDTFAQATPGANENSGEDMGKALAHCRRLHQATGALILLVHHSGKDAAKGARGWSGLKAAADAEIEVLRDGDHRSIRLSKLKDGSEGQELPFKLAPIVLGLDEDGDEVTSCVVEHTEHVPVHQRKGEAKGNVQKLVVRVLHDLMGLDAGPVLITDLLEHSVQQMVPPEQGKRDQRRAHVGRAVEALVAANVLRLQGDKVEVCE
jgi:hypothetical protein